MPVLHLHDLRHAIRRLERAAAGLPDLQDDRQYVGLGGQHWTTQDALAETHENHVEELEPGLWSVETRPAFGIGQRAHLLRTPAAPSCGIASR